MGHGIERGSFVSFEKDKETRRNGDKGNLASEQGSGH
jgi:hypothetical protein